MLPDKLARHLEETEAVEEAVDPAASIPKKMMKDYKRALRGSQGAESIDSTSQRSPSSLFRRGSDLSSPTGKGFAGGPSLLQVPSHGSWRSGDGSQAPASPTSMRASHRPGTGDSEPLASVAEAGVMIPNRSSSRRKKSKDQTAGGVDDEEDEEDAEAGVSPSTAAGDQTLTLTPTKRRDANATTLERNMSRRTYRRDVSGAMSGVSGGTTQRTVTLKAALRAEALEEERRIGLKERLAASKGRRKRNVSGNASAQLEGLEEARAAEEEDDEQDGTTPRRAANVSTIMGRYEAEHRRREAGEFGLLTPGRDGGMRRDVSQGSQLADYSPGQLDRSASSAFGGRRFRTAALGVLSLSRTQKAARDASATSAVPMQELGQSTNYGYECDRAQSDPRPGAVLVGGPATAAGGEGGTASPDGGEEHHRSGTPRRSQSRLCAGQDGRGAAFAVEAHPARLRSPTFEAIAAHDLTEHQ